MNKKVAIVAIGMVAFAMSAVAQTFYSPVGANAGSYPTNTNSLWVGDSQYGLNSYDGVLRMLNTVDGGGIAFRVNLNGTFTDAMYLNGYGSVGIGTTSPSSKLQLYGDSGQTTGAMTDGGSRGSNLEIDAANSAYGSGAALTFGNNQSIGSGSMGMAAIKGFLYDGSGNTSGAIAFSTRSSSSATALGSLCTAHDFAV